MNNIIYKVKKNVAKKKDGFNPVTSEKGYSKVTFEFDDDWKKCDIVTANFFVSADDIVKSEAQLLENMTASFEVPARLRNTTGKIFCGVVGTYADDEGNTVTISTQVITLNALRGLRIVEEAPMNLYEQIIVLVNKIDLSKVNLTDYIREINNLTSAIKGLADTLSEKQLTSNIVSDERYVTDESIQYPSLAYLNSYFYRADETYSNIEIDKKLDKKADSTDVDTALGTKINSNDLLDTQLSINLVSISDGSQTVNGVTATVNGNKITVSGTSTATMSIYLPIKRAVTLKSGLPYCLSLQNFSTNNTGIVVYPCNGNSVLGSWLLSEVSALKNSVATYTPTADTVVDAIRLSIAAGRTVDNSFNLQIEQNNQGRAWANPDKVIETIKPQYYMSPDYRMNYLYVSNDYNEDTEGFGETYFRTILDANNSISDNDYHNRYTIIVAPGTYTDLQDKYAGMSDVRLVGYRGIMTKNYVYYESENIYNPAATVIKWDGATGFDTSTLKSEDIIKKCPFHLDLNVHTHVKGFTFDCKNIRYGIHLESGGTGYATNWVVSNCIFKWGGRADCTDYVDKTTVPVFGCGHSFGEVGLIENCKIIPTHCTVGYQNHDNADNSSFGLPIKTGANITFRNCDFGGTEIQARTIKGEYADTPNVLNIDGCVNISEVKELYDSTAATKCDWTVNITNSKIGNEEG